MHLYKIYRTNSNIPTAESNLYQTLDFGIKFMDTQNH